MLSHGFTSAALFFLVGLLAERFHTRSILVFSGLQTVLPLFSWFLIVISLANIGFPGTSNFIAEFLLLTALIQSTPFLLIPVLFGMFLSTGSTLLLLLRVLFGHVKTSYITTGFCDLSKLEIFVLSNLVFLLIFFGFKDIFMFYY